MSSALKLLVALLLMAGAATIRAQSPPVVLQRGYDANVSGANLAETALNIFNVGPNTFGELFTLPVDASVYAQALYVPSVAIPGLGTHNVLYVATMNDSVFAFDADAGGPPLWSINLASRLNTTAVVWQNFAIPPVKYAGKLGILSTPVIDPSTNIMYVVACTLESGTMAYQLHAIDITTGMEPYGPGVPISGIYGSATFNAQYMVQRTSLVLAANQVIVAFGAMEAELANNYVGWVMAYNKLTLQQSGVFATVTTSSGGGIWQSGRPPVVDSGGYVYLFVGNAFGSGYDGVNNFSESALKLDPSQGLTLLDWFTPSNWSILDAQDLDLTSSGPLLIPGTSLLAGGGKKGTLYVLNAGNLGKLVANDRQVVQEESISTGEIHGGPVFWNRSAANGGSLLYNWSAGDVLKAFSFNGGTFALSPGAASTLSAIAPGGALALSANVDQPGSGLLWATTSNVNPQQAVLHAFDAGNVTNELWNSMMVPSRDGFGSYVKFVPPLVVNGKVYVASLNNKVVAYGLGVATPNFTLSPTAMAFGSVTITTPSTAQLVTVTNSGSSTLSISSITFNGASSGQFSQTNTCGTSVPIGSTCTISVVFTPASTGVQTAWLNVNGGNGVETRTTQLVGTGVPPNFTVAPISLAFGNVLTGTSSTAQFLTVTDGGNAALPITGITLSGAGSGQFSQTNTCSSPVPIGSTCTISVVFSPTSGGKQAATIRVSSSGVTNTAAMSGTGSVPFSMSLSSLAFGGVKKGTASSAQMVTVINGGIAPLPITSVTFSGSNPSAFSQTNTCGTSVAVGSTCTISVVFAPLGTGGKSATLTVNAGGVTNAVTLTGTGL